MLQAVSKKITKFMGDKQSKFMIPVYQRNYDWKKSDQCQVLWDDLEYIIEQGNNKPHFFGSIVSVRDAKTGDFVIIDGQQRLTTVSLLMLAIAHKIEIFQKYETDIELPDIVDVMSYCVDAKNKQRLKLKLIRGDMEAYQSLIESRSTTKYSNSKIVQNYQFFYNQLTLENITNIYQAMHQLEIVDIRLGDNDDNPQQVFESLNSKGKELEDADKIRNFILMGLDYETQENFYKKYWEPMEENAGTSPEDTTKYIWNYLAYKTNKKSSLNDVYKQFKDYRMSIPEPEHLLKDLLEMSDVYFKIKTTSGFNFKIDSKLHDLLVGMETKVAVPLLLDVCDKYEKNIMTSDEVVELISTIEAYFVRRSVCRLKTAGTDKFFLINKKIDRIVSSNPGAKYLDVFKYVLYYDTSSLRFPDNMEFVKALTENDIYSNDKKTCKYILGKFEIYNNPREHIDVFGLTIEHIMPQTLSQEWKEDLGVEWEYVHSKYLHTLGNLTLTGYNSSFGNQPFRYKKRVAGGFDESLLYLNKYMKDTEIWTEKEIKERGEFLARQFVEVWPTYKPEHKYEQGKDVQRVSLETEFLDDIVPRKKPQSVYLEFTDTEYKTDDWRQLYVLVINALYESNVEWKSRMQKIFRHGGDGDFVNIISKEIAGQGQNGERFWEQIIPGENIYFRLNKSAVDLLKALRIWFSRLKIDFSDLEIELRDSSK